MEVSDFDSFPWKFVDRIWGEPLWHLVDYRHISRSCCVLVRPHYLSLFCHSLIVFAFLTANDLSKLITLKHAVVYCVFLKHKWWHTASVITRIDHLSVLICYCKSFCLLFSRNAILRPVHRWLQLSNGFFYALLTKLQKRLTFFFASVTSHPLCTKVYLLKCLNFLNSKFFGLSLLLEFYGKFY